MFSKWTTLSCSPTEREFRTETLLPRRPHTDKCIKTRIAFRKIESVRCLFDFCVLLLHIGIFHFKTISGIFQTEATFR